MKKMLIAASLILLICCAAFAQEVGKTVWISSKTAELKASASAFASVTATLKMADQVTVLKVNGNWCEVRSSANATITGWTAKSNLSTRRIVASGSSASASEVALAGKGFNQEVENSYKTQGKVNYDAVDRTEAIKIPTDELYKFVTEGHLNTGE